MESPGIMRFSGLQETLKFIHRSLGRTRQSRPKKGGTVRFPAKTSLASLPGWLLVLVHDVPAAASDLVILDAKTLTAVAELRVDTLLPLGLHGSWSADA